MCNHNMQNVTGGYTTLCQPQDIGDELHYLFICEKFTAERTRYIKEYYYHPNIFKMTQLFESKDFKDMLDLAKFAE